jgi:hypothetical protein
MGPQGFAPAAAPGERIEDRIARLGELHSKGVIDDSEFAEAKRKLLDEL